MASQDCCNFEGIFETLLGAIFRIDCVLGFYSLLVQAEKAQGQKMRWHAQGRNYIFCIIAAFTQLHCNKSAGEE